MIYLPNTTGEEKTFLDILNLLYDKRISNYTITKTFSDKECTLIECTEFRRRSLQALIEIARTYFPEITLEEIFKAIYEKRLDYYICGDIKRLVFHHVHHKLFKDIKTLDLDFNDLNSKVIDDLQEFLFDYNSKKTFFRIGTEDKEGLWYNNKGEHTGRIHSEFSFCNASKMEMPLDEKLVGFLSAAESMKDLFKWFTKEEIIKLQEKGFHVYEYESSDYKYYFNFKHYVFLEETATLKNKFTL